MATEVASRPQQERSTKRKPFSNLMKRITNFNKSSDQQDGGKNKKGGIPLTNSKHKKSNTQNGFKNNPYAESGPMQKRGSSPASSANGQLSFATRTSRPQDDSGSYDSDPNSAMHDREGQSNSNRSGAPTLATNPETVHSDAGHSKAPTATTNGGALSSIDGAGAGSTFSSPNQSERSLTTTLTTIQSQSPGNALGPGVSGHHNNNHHGNTNNANPVMFSHQYPTSPAPSHMTASAIPRHVASTLPNTYNSATADNLLTDNASILTLASSSKRRRRSMDTDASVRALAPSSVWGGSRESLPLSVLSGNAEPSSGLYAASQSRPSIGGLASAERASMYSSQGVAAPALASERNSFYSHKPTKDLADAKSLRSITNIDARSQFDGRSAHDGRSAYDAKSINDAKSMDVSSLRNYEGSVRSGAIGHGRNDSIPGSIGSPLASPGFSNRHASTSGALSVSRRSSDWQEAREDADDVDDDDAAEKHAAGGLGEHGK
ncbi:hypothetical protein LTR85_011624 [Meristemomyces frigidus]|nr:hypothetical protein LTR85_011624 [Meristemomyces frigidus]